MAKPEPINIRKIVDSVRDKINSASATEKVRLVAGIGQELNIPTDDLERTVRSIKPTLERTSPSKLINIANAVGVDTSKATIAGTNKNKNVIVSDPTNPNGFVTGKRKNLEDSLSTPRNEKERRTEDIRKAKIETRKKDTEDIASLSSLDPESAQEYINEGTAIDQQSTDTGRGIQSLLNNPIVPEVQEELPKEDGLGIKFLNKVFGRAKEVAGDFGLKGVMSEKFQQEAAPVVPIIAAGSAINNMSIAAQEGKNPLEILKAAGEAAPFGKLIDTITKGEDPSNLTSLTEPINVRPPRDLIMNVVKAFNPQAKEPESPIEKLALDVVGGMLTGSPLAVNDEIINASKAIISSQKGFAALGPDGQPTPKPVDATKATINKDKIPEAQKPIVEGIEQTTDISAKTRGKMSIPEINEKARTGKITVEELSNLPEGTALPAEELQRARALTSEAIGTADETIAKFLSNPNDENALLNALASTKQAVQTLTSTRGAMAEAGRSLRVLRETTLPQVKLPSDAKQILENIDKESFIKFATEFKDAIAAGNQELASTLLKSATKKSFFDKAVDFSNALLLTNPQTDMVNTVGNTLANITMLTEKPFIAGVDKVRSILTKTPRERFLGEAQHEAFATMEGIKQGAGDFVKVMTGQLEEAGKIAELQSKVMMPKQGLDKASDLVFRRLGAEDAFFKGIKRSQSIAGQAFRIAQQEGTDSIKMGERIKQLMENPTKEMLDEANKVAQQATFQDELGAFTKQLNKLRQFPIARVIFPFFKTIVNLTKFTARRSPLAMTPGTKSFRQIMGKEGAGTQSEAIGRMIMGTTAMIPVAMGAAQGMVTGAGPTDKKQRELLMSQGWQPYSIRIGNKYIPYRRAEPLAQFMASIATIVERTSEDSEATQSEKIQQALTDAAKFISDQTFWRSTTELADFTRGRNPRFGINMIASRAVPPGVSLVARAIDPVYREPKGLGETLKSRIPGLSKSVPAKQDAFGQPIVREGGVVNRVTPFPTSTFKENPAAQEMIRLDVHIPEQGDSLNNKPVPEDVRRKVNQQTGFNAGPQINKLIKSASYKRMPDTVKEKRIKTIISISKKKAQRDNIK